MMLGGAFFRNASANPGGGGGSVSIASTDTHADFANPSTGTSKSLGATANDRVTLVSVAWKVGGVPRQLNSVTVGGVSCTRLVRTNTTDALVNAEIWAIDSGASSALSANTSANVVFTWSAGVEAVTADIYRIIGGSVTPTATGSGQTSVTFTVPANGAALVVAANGSTTAGTLSNVTEDFNSNDTVPTMRGIHGHTATAGSTTSTCSLTGAQVAAAAFGPS